MKTLEKIYEYAVTHWSILGPALLGLFEAILRCLPTGKNYSLLDFIYKIVSKTVPNNRKPNGTERGIEYDDNGEQKNKVSVRMDKHIVKIIILFILSVPAFAQNPNNQFKAIYGTLATDTAFIKATRASLQLANGNTGGLYFDKIRNKWKIWVGTCASCAQDSTWIDLPLSGGGILTASNGLTKVGTDVRLGGTLNANTNITGGTRTLNVTGAAITLTATSSVIATGAAVDITATSGNMTIDSPTGDAVLHGATTVSVRSDLDLELRALNDIQFRSGGSATLRAIIDSDGSFDWSSSAGTAGQALLSNGASAPPAWGNVISGTATSTRVAYGNTTANTITNEAAFNYNATTDLLTVPSLALTAIPASFGVLYYNSNIVSNEGAFIYNSSTDELQIGSSTASKINPTSYAVDSNGDVNYTTYTETGLTTTAAGDYTLSISDDLFLSTAPDVSTTNTDVLTRNSSTGEIERRTINTSVTTTGNYTPTLTNTTNIASSTVHDLFYSRTNDLVTVSGTVGINVTAISTASELRFSLPATPDFNDAFDCGGAANSMDVVASGGFESIASGSQVSLRFISPTFTATGTWSFSFTYKALAL